MHPRYDRFEDRTEAGRRLAARLKTYANHPSVLVLGLPRGGVPVAYEIAQELNAHLDICLVRKLGVPSHQEIAMGAIAARGVRVINYDVASQMRISIDTINTVAVRELQELQRQDRLYRFNRPQPMIRDRLVILVDDGMATGATMRAAISVIEAQQPAQIIVAVPVAPADTCEALRAKVDAVVCLLTPTDFEAIGAWYEDFSPTADAEVCRLLSKSISQPHYTFVPA